MAVSAIFNLPLGWIHRRTSPPICRAPLHSTRPSSQPPRAHLPRAPPALHAPQWQAPSCRRTRAPPISLQPVSAFTGFNFVFERPITIKNGKKNDRALLSVTVELKNSGAFCETMPAGIVGGPVQLITGNKTTDLSNSTWSYKIGLDGEENQLHVDPGVKWKFLQRDPSLVREASRTKSRCLQPGNIAFNSGIFMSGLQSFLTRNALHVRPSKLSDQKCMKKISPLQAANKRARSANTETWRLGDEFIGDY